MQNKTIELYKENGFVLMKNCLKKSILINIQDKIRNIFKIFTKGIGSDAEIINLYQKNKECYLCCAKECHNIPEIFLIYNYLKSYIKSLGIEFPAYNMKPVIHFSSKDISSHNFYWKTNPHQDWYGMRGSLDGLVCWIPIFEIKKEHGYLELVPKSHTLGLNKHIETGPTYEMIENTNQNFESIECSLGDAIFFSAFTIHKSGVNITDSIRLAISYRFDNINEKTFYEKHFPQSFKYIRNESSLDYNKEELKNIFS